MSHNLLSQQHPVSTDIDCDCIQFRAHFRSIENFFLNISHLIPKTGNFQLCFLGHEAVLPRTRGSTKDWKTWISFNEALIFINYLAISEYFNE